MIVKIKRLIVKHKGLIVKAKRLIVKVIVKLKRGGLEGEVSEKPFNYHIILIVK